MIFAKRHEAVKTHGTWAGAIREKMFVMIPSKMKNAKYPAKILGTIGGGASHGNRTLMALNKEDSCDESCEDA
jgi:hypothetical protein